MQKTKLAYKNQRILKLSTKSSDFDQTTQTSTLLKKNPDSELPPLENPQNEKSRSLSNSMKGFFKNLEFFNLEKQLNKTYFAPSIENTDSNKLLDKKIDVLYGNKFNNCVEGVHLRNNKSSSRYFDSNNINQKAGQELWKETEKQKYEILKEKADFAALMLNKDKESKSFKLKQQKEDSFLKKSNKEFNLLNSISDNFETETQKIMNKNKFTLEEQFLQLQDLHKNCFEQIFSQESSKKDELIKKIWHANNDIVKAYINSLELRVKQAKERHNRDFVVNNEITSNNKVKAQKEQMDHEKNDLLMHYMMKEKKNLEEITTLEKKLQAHKQDLENYMNEIAKLKKSQVEREQIYKIEKELLQNVNKYIDILFKLENVSNTAEPLSIQLLNDKLKKNLTKVLNQPILKNASSQTFNFNFQLNSSTQCDLKPNMKNIDIQTYEEELILRLMMKKNSSGENNNNSEELKICSMMSMELVHLNQHFEVIPEVNESIELSAKKSNSLKIKLFSNLSSESWEKKNEINYYPMNYFCDLYCQEMDEFYTKLEEWVKLKEGRNFNLADLDFLVKNKKNHVEFMKTFYLKDSLKQKELIDLKIELYEKKFLLEANQIKIRSFETLQSKLKELIKKCLFNSSSEINEKIYKSLNKFDFNASEQKTVRKISTPDVPMRTTKFKKQSSLFNLTNDFNSKSILAASENKDWVLQELKAINEFGVQKLVHKKEYESASYLFYQKINEKLMKSKQEELETTTLPSLLKIISTTLSESLKFLQKQEKSLPPLFSTLYDHINTNYGGRKSATEKKILKTLNTLLLYSEKPKIRFFTFLLGFDFEKLKFENYTPTHDLEFFLSEIVILEKEMANRSSISHLLSSNDEKIFIPYATALQLTIKYINGKLEGREEDLKLISKNSLKKDELINSVISYLKDVKTQEGGLSFIELFLWIAEMFRIREELRKVLYLGLFDSWKEECVIGSYEFQIIHKHLGGHSKGIMELFKKESTLTDSEGRNHYTDFHGFCYMCENLGFSGVTAKYKGDIFEENSVEMMRNEWEFRKYQLKSRLIRSNKYNSLFKDKIDQIESYVSKYNVKDKGDFYFWLQYKILEDESKGMLLEHEIFSFIPKEFGLINKICDNNL